MPGCDFTRRDLLRWSAVAAAAPAVTGFALDGVAAAATAQGDTRRSPTGRSTPAGSPSCACTSGFWSPGSSRAPRNGSRGCGTGETCGREPGEGRPTDAIAGDRCWDGDMATHRSAAPGPHEGRVTAPRPCVLSSRSGEGSGERKGGTETGNRDARYSEWNVADRSG
ncbi:twin-arginine translocation signal domain-containing protein [Actinacidiphila oryziradicis]